MRGRYSHYIFSIHCMIYKGYPNSNCLTEVKWTVFINFRYKVHLKLHWTLLYKLDLAFKIEVS